MTGFSAGDEVIGFTDNRASQAEYVLVEATNLAAKPAAVPWEVAGAPPVAGFTAYAAVRAVALTEGDTVVVSGAAGGVGSITVQLARRARATVIGVAGAANHEWLAGHGVIPVSYGDGVAGRIRQAAGRVDAFIDTFGDGYVELALEFGVAPSRVDTIATSTPSSGMASRPRAMRRGPARACSPSWRGWSPPTSWCPIAAVFRWPRSRMPTGAGAGPHPRQIVLVP